MAHSWPFNPSHVSSEYGPRDPVSTPGGSASSFHRGIDAPLALGAPIYASEDGVVQFARLNGTAGNHVQLAHPYSKVTEYMHQRAIEVAVGQAIRKGQTIGHVGMTGATTGPHLHWGTLDLGSYRNPRDFMTDYGDGKIIGVSSPASGSISPITEDHEMATQYIQASDNDALSAGVGSGDWWCRQPGQPLMRITNGQATDAFIADGIGSGPFNFPNVRQRPGKWFLGAFEEDRVVHGYSVGAHPWLAAGAVLDPKTLAAALKTALTGMPIGATADEIADKLATRLGA